MIAGDFIGWLQGQAPTSRPAFRSLVRYGEPRQSARYLLGAGVVAEQPVSAPREFPHTPIYFPPPSGTPPSFYTGHAIPWN